MLWIVNLGNDLCILDSLYQGNSLLGLLFLDFPFPLYWYKPLLNPLTKKNRVIFTFLCDSFTFFKCYVRRIFSKIQ